MSLYAEPRRSTHASGNAWRVRLGLLGSGDLRLVWLAQVVSQLGDGMFTVGIVWLTVRLTGSGLALSGTLMAQLLPYALLGAAAGALSDRWNRRLTMVASDVVRGLVVVLIPLADVAGVLHPWMIAVVAFLLTSAGQFFDPAKSALIPAITPERDLVRVNAFLSGTRQALFIAAPAVGGALMAGGGAMAVFWIDAFTFFLSAAILLRMQSSGHARTADREPMFAGDAPTIHSTSGALLADIRAGFRYAWKAPVLRRLLIFGTAVNFLLSPLPVLIPLFFVKALGISAAGFGSLLSVIFLGFLVGVTFVGVRGQQVRIGLLTVAAMALAGAATALLGTAPPLPAVLALGLLGGASIGAMEVAQTTLLQRETADDLRGRVFALYQSVSQGGRVLSVVLAGGLFELLGMHTTFYAVGLLTIACAAALIASPAVRRVR